MKDFNTNHVRLCAEHLFPTIVSCNPFFELIQKANLPFVVFVKTCFMGQSTGISFIDSRPVRVFKNKRILRNKVIAGLAAFSIFSEKPVIKYRPLINNQTATLELNSGLSEKWVEVN